ncbi:deoxyguanosinetriphosphate triphosphohydrolase [Tindallia californiensis]|uniref:dGTPase n=1 Tax=Tindallia californiensis TaxID=159292 RepID=A0A1H3JRW0_9FIRM|nr:deoxyguanosinetriphosphate triphosphohydrolase [Tindallia californiensis]SDY42672.1 dGTPase [Tindallia californiensis]
MKNDLEIRKISEEYEKISLCQHAQVSMDTKGRKREEDECDIRTAYQRDRDRIIHCESFRKLKGKTQVFISHDENFRTRLTHTLELSQIARTIARALRLNEDLIEAIALGHDLGHTCFGHSGEEVLDRLTGHFAHNEQSLRVVDQLENGKKGLNLTFEVRDGILNHTGDGIPVTMEGKLVKITDRITYLCHDIQDSLVVGILSEGDIPERFNQILGTSHSKRVNAFVQDMITETARRLKMGDEAQVYQSDKMKTMMMDLRSFMFQKVYNGDVCMKEKEKATLIVEHLYHYYRQTYSAAESADRIAGCTDQFAINLYKELVIPQPGLK